MRVADKMAYDQVNRAISKNRSEMSSLQNQAATQKRVNKPSDDPVAASRVLFSRIDQRGNEQFVKNLNYAKGFLDFTEQSLGELTEVMVRAKELAISQSSDASSSAQSRRVVAEEVKQLLSQTVQIANRKLGERFIFGGFNTTDAPFSADGAYKGDLGEMKIHVDKTSFVPMNVPGAVVFHGKGLSKEGFNFKSEPQAKNLKEFLAQNSEQSQTSEALKTETVQEANGASSENSNEPMRGPASVRITESTAEVTDIPQFADESANDGVSVFQTLKKLEVALATNDKAGIQESLDRIDDSMQQVVVARASVGSRISTLENTLNTMHTNIVDNKTTVSQLEDADAFEVISDINKTESALQATLQTSGKLMQKSLMDFIS